MGHVKAAYDSPVGRIGSSWSIEDDRITYEFNIPANAEATVVLGEKTLRLESGEHRFTEEVE